MLGWISSTSSADPPIGLVAVLQRHLVGGETGWVEIDRVVSISGTDHLEHPDLGGEIEPVARFGLDGRRSVLQERVETGDGGMEAARRKWRPWSLEPWR